MKHVDPASEEFTALKPREQARIYHAMGWTVPALMEEFDRKRNTIQLWIRPGAYERCLQYCNRYSSSEHGKQKRAARREAYKASPGYRAMREKEYAQRRAKRAALRTQRGSER